MGPVVLVVVKRGSVIRQSGRQNSRIWNHKDSSSIKQDCVVLGFHIPHATTYSKGVRSARDFFKPLAAGAPTPVTEIPFKPSRVIHFFPPHNEKMVSKLPETIPNVDIILGNLEDAIPMSDKQAARDGLIKVANELDFGSTQLWSRVNSLDSPWFLDDMIDIVTKAGHKFDVIMIPKVEGPEDIHYVDRLLAQLEARAGLKKPILLHAILETARGVANVEEICGASPRMQGISLGPADLAANRRMKTTRVGGGHPDYVVRQDPEGDDYQGVRPTYQQDLWHYTMARMVDACVMHGVLPFYGPFGDIKDVVACEDQFRNAYLLGCVGAWSLHPVQIDIAKRVFSPRPEDVRQAQRVIDAMGDGTGAIMLDGKMEDDASVKQCKVVVELARQLAERDPALAASYGFTS
jgi:malyl-CoA/(S)-citramalyl-CoA lyase